MELNSYDQADALIKHWLGATPADDLDDYLLQIKQSLWLEERQQRYLAQVMGAKIR